MNTQQLIELLKSEEKDHAIDQVVNWTESGLLSQYISVFGEFRKKVDESLSGSKFIDLRSGNDFGFELVLFGGQTSIQVVLTFVRVDGFNLLGGVVITTDPNSSDADKVAIPFTKSGEIVDPATGKIALPQSLGGLNGTIQMHARHIIGAVVRDAVPFEVLSRAM